MTPYDQTSISDSPHYKRPALACGHGDARTCPSRKSGCGKAVAQGAASPLLMQIQRDRLAATPATANGGGHTYDPSLVDRQGSPPTEEITQLLPIATRPRLEALRPVYEPRSTHILIAIRAGDASATPEYAEPAGTPRFARCRCLPGKTYDPHRSQLTP